MAVYDPSAPGTGSLSTDSPFSPLCTPGKGVFVVWGEAYAPPLGAAPAQFFVGEWTGTSRGADLGICDLETGKWRSVPFDNVDRTNTMFVDPYRPVIFLSNAAGLFEIDRVSLAVKEVAKIPLRYTADFDRQGRLWLSQTRVLNCYDPTTGQMTEYKDVIPDEFFYAPGTHAQIGVGPDGRIWLTQIPIAGLSVFDPATGKSTVISRSDPADPRGYGIPVVVGNVVLAGPRVFDATTGEPIVPPFPIEGPDAFHIMMRGAWSRTPSVQLQRENQILAWQRDRVGWLDVVTGGFDLLGRMPANPSGTDYSHGIAWSLHGTHTLLGADTHRLARVDLMASTITYSKLDFVPKHAQRIYHWHVGPKDHVYASGMSHDLWDVAPDGASTNHGDLIKVRGGELHAMSTWKDKLFIVSYTGSVLTRVDTSRPTDNWGKEPHHNPRHLLDMISVGQHRPRGSDITPDGRLYFVSCSDYCTRTEGAMVIVNVETEEIEQVLDPLIPGEQIFALAVSHTRPEVYVGTSEGTFVVWDHAARKIKHIHKFTPRPGDGTPTSAMIKVGGVRFMATCGDIVVGNIFGGEFETWTYHADTGVMDEPRSSPHGKLFGVWPWRKRNSIVARFMASMYEIDAKGRTTLLYPEPLPGFLVNEDSSGRLLLSDDITIFAERNPAVMRRI